MLLTQSSRQAGLRVQSHIKSGGNTSCATDSDCESNQKCLDTKRGKECLQRDLWCNTHSDCQGVFKMCNTWDPPLGMCG